MKTLLSLAVIFITLTHSRPLFAVNFTVTGACQESPEYAGNFKVNLNESAGKMTVEFFNEYKVPYVGNEIGMNSILNTPTGTEAIEIISDTKMRAYGWCFSINGEIPDTLAGETYLTKQNDSLSWFFAFSTYDQGVWIDYCVPAYTIKAPQFCK